MLPWRSWAYLDSRAALFKTLERAVCQPTRTDHSSLVLASSWTSSHRAEVLVPWLCSWDRCSCRSQLDRAVTTASSTEIHSVDCRPLLHLKKELKQQTVIHKHAALPRHKALRIGFTSVTVTHVFVIYQEHTVPPLSQLH